LTTDVGRGTARTIRQVSDRTALDLLAEHGPLTRPQLREMSGLAQPTIIDLVNRLTESGLIEQVGQADALRPGPRPVLYALRQGNHLSVGAHVLDNELSATVRDLAGGARHTLVRKADATHLPEQIVSIIHAVLAEAGREGESPAYTVVGVPGIVDRTTGDLGFAWDLPQWRSGILQPVREALGGSVELINGVHLVALAEGLFLDGAGELYALVWLGIGVGLTVIVNGRPWLGSSGAAGQIGYMPVPGAPVLPVDQQATSPGGFQGDFQALVGTRALRDLGREIGIPGRTVRSMITNAAQGQTPESESFIDEVARRIAVGLASIASAMDPGVFVLHGETGVAGGAHLAARVERHLRSLSPISARVREPRYTDGRDAALVGALNIAQKKGRQLMWGGYDTNP
jgi:predicted NBD/HSP70 family sugar kinase